MFSFFVVVQLLNYAQSELAVLNLEDGLIMINLAIFVT